MSLETYWEEQIDPKDLLFNARKKSWDHFLELGLPRPKQEAFQYLPLSKLQFPKPAERKTLSLAPAQTPRIVFVDGFFEESLSHLPSPLVCLPLDQAMRTYGLFLQNRLAKTLKEEKDPFAVLNGALQGRGAFLYAPPKFRLETPIEVVHHFTGVGFVSPRLEVYLGRMARLELIQSYTGNPSFCNLAIESSLDEGSELIFTDLQERQAQFFEAVRATQKRDSRFVFRAFTQGAPISRTSMKVLLAEENSETLLQGLWSLTGDLQNHIHATVEHAAPNTRSRQHFRGVLREKSRSSFEGKIFVRPIAQKTEAYQLNRNLVLSDEASAHAKPNLEIFADDVKASHGATVSQLDAEELFYLRSRGLDLDEAKKWLVNGFCSELIPTELKERLGKFYEE